jgi:dipeptidyl aminopeptidase/acylaminoacyl peptidase
MSGRKWALLLILLPAAAIADVGRSIAAETYRRAEAVLPSNVAPKLRNGAITPIWLPDGNRFWYRRETPAGWEYVAVDPGRATRAAAFNHVRLAVALSKVLGVHIDSAHLPLDDLTFQDRNAGEIRFAAMARVITCKVASSECRVERPSGAAADLVVSPDGRQAAFVRDYNLWIKVLATGAERRLTDDGVDYFAYGRVPDSLSDVALKAQTTNLHLRPYGLDWSPDSRWLVVTRMDERAVANYPFVQFLSPDGRRRPRVLTIRRPLAGESNRPVQEVSIIDTHTGARSKVNVGPGLSLEHWWAPDGRRFLAVQGEQDRFYVRQVSLAEVSSADGALRPVLTESSRTFVQTSPLLLEEPAIAFLARTNEAIWYSQRDGWGHLYLVDVGTGAIKSLLTPGEGSVRNIIRIDESSRRLFFTAVGREAGEDPYYRHLYSVSLDGHDLRALTPDSGDHAFPGATLPPQYQSSGRPLQPAAPALISPSGRFMIDIRSTVSEAPVSILKRIDGTLVMTLETADVAAVLAAGWITPEPFVVKAADGKTDIYGLLVRPEHFDPRQRFPIVDAIYNGPFLVTAPHSFLGALRDGPLGYGTQSFAQLGFVAIIMDSRGTPLRSKAFQDYIYNNLQEFGLEDHVAALRTLAQRNPWMDLDRVGLFGHSFGGYTALKGILGYPQFFKVAVASAGDYDEFGVDPHFAGLFEPPIFHDGASSPQSASDRPTNWGDIDLTQHADRLQGRLLLAYGDLDENVYPYTTIRLINALIAANKTFDLLYLPGRNHEYLGEGYFIRRRWDYFVRHLLGAEPPKDYPIEAAKP